VSQEEGEASQSENRRDELSTEPYTDGLVQVHANSKVATEMSKECTLATESDSENASSKKATATSGRLCKRKSISIGNGRSTSSSKKTNSAVVREEDNALKMISHAIREQVNKPQVINGTDDEYDKYGRYIACELRNITHVTSSNKR